MLGGAEDGLAATESAVSPGVSGEEAVLAIIIHLTRGVPLHVLVNASAQSTHS